jgi:hypothetical protein
VENNRNLSAKLVLAQPPIGMGKRLPERTVCDSGGALPIRTPHPQHFDMSIGKIVPIVDRKPKIYVHVEHAPADIRFLKIREPTWRILNVIEPLPQAHLLASRQAAEELDHLKVEQQTILH